MSLRLWTAVIDCEDPAKLAHWWADAIDWKIFYESDDEVVITALAPYLAELDAGR